MAYDKIKSPFSGYTADGKYCGRTREEWNEFWKATEPEKKARPYKPARGCYTVDLTPRYRKSSFAPWG